uniref:Ovule protein n=1 Tax=Strongyloides venezuelensis TaxID=75913 RepID=A0A0K0FJV3_STRVS
MLHLVISQWNLLKKSLILMFSYGADQETDSQLSLKLSKNEYSSSSTTIQEQHEVITRNKTKTRKTFTQNKKVFENEPKSPD